MSKKPSKRRRQGPAADSRGGALAAQAPDSALAAGAAGTADRAQEAAPMSLLALAPAAVIVLAVLWDWLVWLRLDGWPTNEDLSIFMYTGQRLADGLLTWTQEFYDNKLPVNQFLFFLPGLLASHKVWLLMSMAGCLAGAWAVHAILHQVFSPARGYAPEVGRHAGLYGGVFTLYLFSTPAFIPHHINPLTVSMALAAAALMQRHVRQPNGRMALGVFLLSCFCANLAVTLRPYLAIFVGLIPLWASLSAQLEAESRKVDYLAAIKLAVLWGAGVTGFVLAINVLPYALTGQLASLLAGLEMLEQRIAPHGLRWTLGVLNNVYRGMGLLSASLYFAWVVFLALFLIGLAGRLHHRAVALDLLVFTLVAPFSILALTLTKNFWEHYTQMLLPFLSIGAVSLVVLVHREGSRHLDFLLRHKAIATLLALLLVATPLTELRTATTPQRMAPTVQNLNQLLAQHGLEAGDFLAPYNQYVHVKLSQHRHGFPNVSISVDGTIKGWYGQVQVPAQYRLPRNFQEYCRMLDEQGPRLVVFFRHTTFYGPSVPGTHLARCQLRNYQLHNVSESAKHPSDIAFYFLRTAV